LRQKAGETLRRLAIIEQRYSVAAKAVVRAREHTVENFMARLDSMSPLRVLDRGYSITQLNDGRILRDASQVSVGSALSIRLARGSIEAEATLIKADR
jgi:exodeoxyribonuclease VII large subunit